MREYFVELQGETKKHSFRVEANFTSGRDFVSNPVNEEQFLAPGEPDEVDILNVYLENDNGKERLIDPVPDEILEALEQKIIENENSEDY